MSDFGDAMDAAVRRAIDARLGLAEDGGAAMLERVKRRVMGSVESQAAFLTVPHSGSGWQAVVPGVERKVLWEEDGRVSCLMRMKAGACFPGHVHEVDEECLVLEGTLRIGDGVVLRQGDYHLGRKGSLHADTTSETGAMVFLRTAACRG